MSFVLDTDADGIDDCEKHYGFEIDVEKTFTASISREGYGRADGETHTDTVTGSGVTQAFDPDTDSDGEGLWYGDEVEDRTELNDGDSFTPKTMGTERVGAKMSWTAESYRGSCTVIDTYTEPNGTTLATCTRDSQPHPESNQLHDSGSGSVSTLDAEMGIVRLKTNRAPEQEMSQTYLLGEEKRADGATEWQVTRTTTVTLRIPAKKNESENADVQNPKIEDGFKHRVSLLPVELKIMKPETSSDAEWEAEESEWKMRTGGRFGKWEPFNFDDNDAFKLKLVTTSEITQEVVDELEFEVAAFDAEPGTTPNWVKLSAKDFGRLSPDKKEIWCTIPAARIKTDVLPQEKPDSTSTEAFSFDYPTTGSFIDSDAFDSAVDADTTRSVNVRMLGNWEPASTTTPEGAIDPWVAAVGKEFIVHGGGIYIAARIGSSSEERAVAKNQVDWMYLSTHGHSDLGTIDVGVGEKITPPDVEWQDDLDIVIIAGCAVLDVNDYNGNYDDDNADGDNDRTTGTEPGPSSLVFNGEKWANTGPKYLLGYNYNAPLDSQNSDRIISDWAAKRKTLGVVEAWMEANDNSNGRHACAIEAGVGYWYFHRKTLFGQTIGYELKFIPAASW